MPVKAISKASIARNGVGSFVKPCFKVTVQYCNWGGSSQGVRDFLTHHKKNLHKVANENKDTMFEVIKRNGHPQIVFHYNTGAQNAVDVRNQSVDQVSKTIWEHIQKSGNAPFKFNQKVMSNNESVRGIWSPMHVNKANRHRI